MKTFESNEHVMKKRETLIQRGKEALLSESMKNRDQCSSWSHSLKFSVEEQRECNGLLIGRMSPIKQPLGIWISHDESPDEMQFVYNSVKGDNIPELTIGISNAMFNIALIHQLRDEECMALKLYKYTLKMVIDVASDELKNQKWTAPTLLALLGTLNNLACISSSSGNRDYGQELCSQAISYGIEGLRHLQKVNLEKISRCTSIKSLTLLKEYLALLFSNVGQLYYMKGEYNRAITCHLQTRRFVQKELGFEHPEVYKLNFQLGQIHRANIDDESAMKHFRLYLTWAINHRNCYFVTSVLNEIEIIKCGYGSKYDPEMDSLQRKLREQRFLDYGFTNVQLPILLNNIGRKLFKCNRCEEAIEYYMEALRLQVQFLEEFDDAKAHKNIILTLFNIAKTYQALESYDEAISALLKALEINSESKLENHQMNCVLVYNLGQVLYLNSSYERALEAFESALCILHESENNGIACHETGIISHNLGVVQLELGRMQDATGSFLKALGIWNDLYGDIHPSVSDTLFQLGRVLEGAGNLNEALEIYRATLEVEISLLGKGNVGTFVTLFKIGQLHQDMGDSENAINIYVELLEIAKVSFGENHTSVADILKEIGFLYLDIGMSEKSKKSMTEARKIFDVTLDQEQCNDDTSTEMSFEMHQNAVFVKYLCDNVPAASAA
eukprot:CAMPEP_0194356402 /NCGR_PEP_ID=MMETSP0174-20130528/4063_1 /TAXON_ID=216777 /ORGANISM="Proboscia alata, Strain PI-D3" /LENGTH=671 /DNA_ID=CAMNT_0039125981 /DNA_START=277 /DNA_END=2292 /DNA_ORIENTATION=-